MSTPEVEEPTVEPGGGKHPETVPYHRLAETSELLKNTRKRARELEEEVTRLRPVGEQFAAVTRERDELRARYEADRQSWQEERSILGTGILEEPDEALEVARLYHGKLPEADRPRLGDWLKSFTGENAQKPPKALEPYIRKPAVSPPAGGAAPPKAEAKPPPKIDNPGKPPPSSPAVDPKALQALRKEAQRTGDHSKLRAALDAIKKVGTGS